MRISSITKNAGKACNNRLYRHIRTFKKIVKNYFVIYFKNDTFVLLHQFRKKTQKTPKREIERAKAERDDYLARKEAE